MTLFRQPITALGLNIAESVDIETPMGPLRGQKSIYSDKEGLFLGIPFAEPPVGDLRWKAPQPAKGWTERRDATRTPKACLQGKPYDLTSEDCLYLNVYTSNLAATSAGGEGAGDAPLKPVMFWIYGGSFEMGGGVSEGKGIDIYDSQAMAHLGDVVVVTINYRLGALGFLALDELRRESPEAGSGNYGLQDQREALRWVQRNIKAFGGDPDRVTIFGESAGAMSVMFHVASKRSAGLFHGAIMQSGNEIGRTWSQATQEGASVVKSLGCAGETDVLACLRSKSGRDVINADAHEVPVPHNADSTLKFGPVVDGVELAVLPRELYATGQLNDVNMMVGTNLNEGAAFVCQKIPPTTPDSEYLAQVAHYVGEDTAQQLVDLFPLKNYKLVRDAIIDLSTAYFFTCPSRHISAGIRNATGRVGSTYRYQLRHAPGILALSAPFYGGGWPTSFCMGVMHMLDLAYTFHNLRFILSPAEKVLSDQMTRFWTNFAHSGDPNIDANGVDARIWPAYEPQAGEDLTVSLDTPIGVLSDLDAARCAVIDKLQDAALSRQNGPPNVLQFLPVM